MLRDFKRKKEQRRRNQQLLQQQYYQHQVSSNGSEGGSSSTAAPNKCKIDRKLTFAKELDEAEAAAAALADTSCQPVAASATRKVSRVEVNLLHLTGHPSSSDLEVTHPHTAIPLTSNAAGFSFNEK